MSIVQNEKNKQTNKQTNKRKVLTNLESLFAALLGYSARKKPRSHWLGWTSKFCSWASENVCLLLFTRVVSDSVQSRTKRKTAR